MPIKLLHHKSYHVYNSANIERVRKDEEAAQVQQEQEDNLRLKLEREQRTEILRRRQRGLPVDSTTDHDVASHDEQETAADRMIRHAVAATTTARHPNRREQSDEFENARSSLSRKSNLVGLLNLTSNDRHINLFEDIETVAKNQANKSNAPTRLLNMRLDKPADELTPWYASRDGMPGRQRQQERERSGRQKEQHAKANKITKDYNDPLRSINDYLSLKSKTSWRRPSSTRSNGERYAARPTTQTRRSRHDDRGDKHTRDVNSAARPHPPVDMARLLMEQQEREARELQLARRKQLRRSNLP
ncbi:hypothetical protein V1514DRAFT_325780 [Lipomyces japonicus]|uniref:uncharacterized protein n=1 Tax=Lipomyces japonicus TaxID=56871 RepID=UPI0034CDF49F